MSELLAPRRMVELEVDGQPVRVFEGSTLLDACRQLGISSTAASTASINRSVSPPASPSARARSANSVVIERSPDKQHSSARPPPRQALRRAAILTGRDAGGKGSHLRLRTTA